MDELPPTKVVLIGSSNVGKTSLFQSFQGIQLNEIYRPTTSGSYASVEVGSSHLVIWDTAGGEMFRSIVPLYFKHARVAIVVYDVTCRESFGDVGGWVALAREHGPLGITVMLVGNKVDLEKRVTREEAEALSRDLNVLFVGNVSAKTGEDVKDLLDDVGKVAIEPVVLKVQTQRVQGDGEQKQEKCRC
jgi:small GTP-binding protein